MGGSRDARRVRAKCVPRSLRAAEAPVGDEAGLPSHVSCVPLLKARGSTDAAMAMPGMPRDRAGRTLQNRTGLSIGWRCSETPCPFCSPDLSRVFFESDLVLGVWDAFAVSDGHALVITRRHVASWFDATPAERAALTEGIAAAREAVLRTHAPDGFNIGINVGRGGWADDSTSPRPRHPPVQRRRSRSAWWRSPCHPGTRATI